MGFAALQAQVIEVTLLEVIVSSGLYVFLLFLFFLLISKNKKFIVMLLLLLLYEGARIAYHFL